MLPRISSYGRYKSGNYGVHCMKVEVGRLTVWFSYETAIAFQVGDGPVYVSENDWGPTTGKHIRWVLRDSPRAAQLPRDEFEAAWGRALRNQGVGLSRGDTRG